MIIGSTVLHEAHALFLSQLQQAGDQNFRHLYGDANQAYNAQLRSSGYSTAPKGEARDSHVNACFNATKTSGLRFSNHKTMTTEIHSDDPNGSSLHATQFVQLNVYPPSRLRPENAAPGTPTVDATLQQQTRWVQRAIQTAFDATVQKYPNFRITAELLVANKADGCNRDPGFGLNHNPQPFFTNLFDPAGSRVHSLDNSHVPDCGVIVRFNAPRYQIYSASAKQPLKEADEEEKQTANRPKSRSVGTEVVRRACQCSSAAIALATAVFVGYTMNQTQNSCWLV